MFKSSFFTSIIVLFLSQALLAGGGWPQPKGHGYFKISQWWSVSDRHFTDAGLIDPNVTTGIFNTSLYAEYGFTDRITGVLYFPFYSRAYNNNLVSQTTKETLVPGEAINSIGDTDIAIKFGLTKDNKIPLTATLLFGLPLGVDDGGSQNNLQTGDGEFNQLLQFDLGTGIPLGIKNVNAYANAYVGVNNRTNGFSDEFRYGLELGAGLFKDKLWLVGRLNAVESFQNGKTAAEITGTSIFANNTEFISLGGEIAYNINDRFGVSAGYASAVSGKIIFAAPSYSVGVFFNLRK